MLLLPALGELLRGFPLLRVFGPAFKARHMTPGPSNIGCRPVLIYWLRETHLPILGMEAGVLPIAIGPLFAIDTYMFAWHHETFGIASEARALPRLRSNVAGCSMVSMDARNMDSKHTFVREEIFWTTPETGKDISFYFELPPFSGAPTQSYVALTKEL